MNRREASTHTLAQEIVAYALPSAEQLTSSDTFICEQLYGVKHSNSVTTRLVLVILDILGITAPGGLPAVPYG
jgi:hypothetical protein